MADIERNRRGFRRSVDDRRGDLAGREARSIGFEGSISLHGGGNEPVTEHALQIVEIIERGPWRIPFDTRFVPAAEKTVVIAASPSVHQIPPGGQTVFML